MNRGRTKVAHRVEGGKAIRAPKKGGWSGAAAGEPKMVRDEGQSRKPRVTLERKIIRVMNTSLDTCPSSLSTQLLLVSSHGVSLPLSLL